LIALFLVVSVLFAAPLSAAESPQAGKIRVLLDPQGDASQVEIGIYGSYLLNDTLSFQRGARLKLTAQTGSLMVYYEGLVYKAGNSLRLIRYGGVSNVENGLRLNDNLNLFEGDLHVSLQDGALHLVLHIGTEDYLKGVVPYEMSDSFPLEALKAQAVAARSYALKSIRTDRDFDVYDNTNDQVYRGLNSDKKNALQAISMTEGLGLVYQGKLAQSYYTASNGGQVETVFNAWGRESLPYSRLTPDPYDLENPASEKRTYAVSKVWQDSESAEPLRQLLLGALIPVLEVMGYDPAPTFISIHGIAGIRATAPMFGGASDLMTRLAFDVWLSARKPLAARSEDEVSLYAPATPSPQAQASPSPQDTWGPMERLSAPLTVELAIFPDVEQALGLSINLKDNEIVRVREEESRFILQSGRYGHGVGMSQRGAEWMAKAHAWTYEQILSYYYPGTQLERFATTPAERPLLAPAYLTTPGPRPTATPRPTLIPLNVTAAPNQWIAEVKGVAKDSSLNLRDAPQLNGKILYQLLYGQRLLVLGQEQDGWLKVRVDGLEGYVVASFVEKVL
jgi:stage II sporulation protein D